MEHRYATLVQVLTLLGAGKVLTPEQVASAWSVEVPQHVVIRYSEEVFRDCAAENTRGRDGRLVYYAGQSLREQRAKAGTNPDCPPCFFYNDWWLRADEDYWSTEKLEAGFYLIDFNGRFASMSWPQQEQEIATLGLSFERAHEAVVVEAIFSMFKTTGEQLLSDWYHWGRSVNSRGRHIGVGGVGRNGLVIRAGVGGGKGMRVCLGRTFHSSLAM